MKSILLGIAAAAAMASTYGQITSARQATKRIEPLVQPAPPSARPGVAAQQPTATAPAAATVAKPADTAKAAAEKAKNDTKQFEFFKRRAEEGSDHAQYELGMRYLSGRGVAADQKLAREWFSKAAKSGNAQAAKKLAELGGE